MKPKQGKYLFYIGIALVLLGLSLLAFDGLVALISIVFGFWTGIKGYRISKGNQPYLIRKYQQKEQKDLNDQKQTHPFERMKKDKE